MPRIVLSIKVECKVRISTNPHFRPRAVAASVMDDIRSRRSREKTASRRSVVKKAASAPAASAAVAAQQVV